MVTYKYVRGQQSEPKTARGAWLVVAGLVTSSLSAIFLTAEGLYILQSKTLQQRADENIVSKARLAVAEGVAAVTNTSMMFSAGPNYSPEMRAHTDLYSYNMARMEICRFPASDPVHGKNCRNTLNMDMEQRNDLEELVCIQATFQSDRNFIRKFCRKRELT